MKQFKQKVWIGIGAFVLAGSQVDFPGKGAPSVGYASALAASPTEGGEGGEGGEAGKRAGPQTKIDWLTGLALVEGHLFVAMELLRAGAKDAAHTHLKHPSDEIYASLRPGFRRYHAAGFARELEQLSKAAGGEKGAAENAYLQVEKKIDLARQKASANAKTQLQVAARLLEDAAGDYRASLKKRPRCGRPRIPGRLRVHQDREAADRACEACERIGAGRARYRARRAEGDRQPVAGAAGRRGRGR
jgi:hypothetical protein